ncbi:DinB family protein [Nakamurella endophytica]|uniref:DinB family protein n=1 Tax=Nakamurella endophytica TaxID=1748367 RepID=A0A917WMA0_9ACTN|nr:DinB family protein [Nakamurella endophytica]GGM14774.1 hypothetical protein GCM10011594_38460 [Nakamurella endophytica]
MIDDAIGHLHEDLQWVRRSLLDTLDGLSEYDVRRPLTATGTNLLGLVRHLTLTEVVYLGDVLGRPFPERHPRYGDPGYRNRDSLWVRHDETRADVVAGYRRACAHADASVAALPADAPGQVPWWPRPQVTLFAVLVHVLTETYRHAGHADILREGITGGADAPGTPEDWAEHRARIEQAARRAAG